MGGNFRVERRRELRGPPRDRGEEEQIQRPRCPCEPTLSAPPVRYVTPAPASPANARPPFLGPLPRLSHRPTRVSSPTSTGIIRSSTRIVNLPHQRVSSDRRHGAEHTAQPRGFGRRHPQAGHHHPAAGGRAVSRECPLRTLPDPAGEVDGLLTRQMDSSISRPATRTCPTCR